MFEKSKSAITFKEFQNNMNIANDFDDDWGHFWDNDQSNNINTNPDINILFKDTLYKSKKREFKKLFQKEEEEINKIMKEIFIDIKDENDNPEENDNKKNIHYLKDTTKVKIIKNIFKCFEVIIVTSVMSYFIFNIL